MPHPSVLQLFCMTARCWPRSSLCSPFLTAGCSHLCLLGQGAPRTPFPAAANPSLPAGSLNCCSVSAVVLGGRLGTSPTLSPTGCSSSPWSSADVPMKESEKSFQGHGITTVFDILSRHFDPQDSTLQSLLSAAELFILPLQPPPTISAFATALTIKATGALYSTCSAPTPPVCNWAVRVPVLCTGCPVLGIALPEALGFSLFLGSALPLSCGYFFSSSGSAGLNCAGSCVHLLAFTFSWAVAGSTHGGAACPCREDFAHLSMWVQVLPRIAHTGLPSFVCLPHEMLIVVPPPTPHPSR